MLMINVDLMELLTKNSNDSQLNPIDKNKILKAELKLHKIMQRFLIKKNILLNRQIQIILRHEKLKKHYHNKPIIGIVNLH